MNSAIVDLFYHDEFEAEGDESHLWISFPQIQNVEEAWAWMLGPMYKALYADTLAAAFPAQLASAAPLVIHGTPLLRQIRGKSRACGQRRGDGTQCFTDPIEADASNFGTHERESTARCTSHPSPALASAHASPWLQTPVPSPSLTSAHPYPLPTPAPALALLLL